MKRHLLLIVALITATTPVLADWKLTQKTKMGGDGMARTSTVYQKGVRQRREEKIDMGGQGDDPEVAAMMSQMGVGMPTFPTHVTQCDLKRDLFINAKNRSYFIDYYDLSTVPPDKTQRQTPNQKSVIKGTMTMETVVTDSGKRQQMFGLTARWLKIIQTMETSADSCDGASFIKMEQEGWFVTLTLPSESCPIQRPVQQPPSRQTGGCRPRMIVKGGQDPGMMLTGTMRTYQGTKVVAAFEIETLELSRATLDPALFDVPQGYAEVESQDELMNRGAAAGPGGGPVNQPNRSTGFPTEPTTSGAPQGNNKTIAIDLLTGASASKVNQNELRSFISGRLDAAGMTAVPIGSQSELAGGRFSNVIGVEITKIKESGASKIGGLFGKVTGTGDASTIGNSTAEVVVTIYATDGKTVIASSPGRADVKGKGIDAAKAAVDDVLGSLLGRIK